MELKLTQGMKQYTSRCVNEITETEAKRNADYIFSQPHCFTTFGLKAYSIPCVEFYKVK